METRIKKEEIHRPPPNYHHSYCGFKEKATHAKKNWSSKKIKRTQKWDENISRQRFVCPGISDRLKRKGKRHTEPLSQSTSLKA